MSSEKIRDQITHLEKTKKRPSFKDIFLDLAFSLSQRSTCRRLSVGCVITSPDFRRVYSIGYNGNVRGGPNDCDVVGEDAAGKCLCIHAEANALIKCDVSSELPKIVFVTTLPCVPCSKLIINLGGVEQVVYRNDYRIKDALTWFDRAGIVTEHRP